MRNNVRAGAYCVGTEVWMLMGRGPKYWAGVAVAGVVGMAVVKLQPDSYEQHREDVITQFHLPEDVEFLQFRSGYHRYGGEFIEATIQLTPGQYLRYKDKLENPSVWTLPPLEHDDLQIEGPPEPGWDRWWDGDMSIVVELDKSPHGARTRKIEKALRGEKYKVIQWVHWGHSHGHGAEGDWEVWDAGKHSSFCWAYAEQNGKKAVRACTAYPPTSWSPDVYVRGLLDHENKRLFVHID